jgi:macrolide-specific efflux system membrane fusion protein
MTVKAKISEADVTRVKPGLQTYFTLLGDADTRYYGTLRAIEPGPVSSGTGTSSNSTSSSSAVYYYGLFEVPNTNSKLKVSMTTQVVIVLNQVKQALCIPASALGNKQNDGRRSTVKVLVGDVAETRTIRTGISNNVQVQVVEGLREGEKVVVGDSTSLPKNESSAMPPPPGGRH